MRSRNQLRRERNSLALFALFIALLITFVVTMGLAQVTVNTGAALGYGFVATMSLVSAVLILIERGAS